jgi:hypothetical protein
MPTWMRRGSSWGTSSPAWRCEVSDERGAAVEAAEALHGLARVKGVDPSWVIQMRDAGRLAEVVKLPDTAEYRAARQEVEARAAALSWPGTLNGWDALEIAYARELGPLPPVN